MSLSFLLRIENLMIDTSFLVTSALAIANSISSQLTLSGTTAVAIFRQHLEDVFMFRRWHAAHVHAAWAKKQVCPCQSRKVDVRLPGKGNSNSHGTRPVYLIITVIKWIWTNRSSIQNSLLPCRLPSYSANCRPILPPAALSCQLPPQPANCLPVLTSDALTCKLLPTSVLRPQAPP